MRQANARRRRAGKGERTRAALVAFAAFAAIALLFGAGCGAPKTPRYEPPEERFVFFNSGRVEVPPDGFFAIGYATALLEEHPSFRVLVVGHADPVGNRAANRDLCWKRARLIARVLLDHGVDAKRVKVGVPREQGVDASMAEISRRVDIFVYDPEHERVEKRVGYAVETERP